jgi:hypothetical protein
MRKSLRAFISSISLPQYYKIAFRIEKYFPILRGEIKRIVAVNISKNESCYSTGKRSFGVY